MMHPAVSDFRILCVEDEPDILRDIVGELRDHGFLVDQASNGLEAIAQVDRAMPDLIVSDIQMPGLSGTGLLQHLRARSDAAADIPFIFLTAFGDRDLTIEARRAGADDYLTKPIDYDLLIAVAQTHLFNTRRRAEQIVRALPRTGMLDLVPNRSELINFLSTQPAGTPYAIVAIDNMMELAARVGNQDPHFCLTFFKRLERWLKVRIFHVYGQKFVIVANCPAALDRLLATLVKLEVRDRTGGSRAKVAITSSIVSDQLQTPLQVEKTLEDVRAAVRSVQREGGARVVSLHSPQMATVQLAGAIRSELVNAIRLGQLSIRLQPKVRACDGITLSAEVLVRWESPVLGALSPATFIPIVERAGLLPHITDLVLRQTAQCQLELLRRGLPARLAVNISALEFGLDLPGRLVAICAEFGADPALIEVEITETALMQDLHRAGQVIDSLRQQGVKVALDDFGTGYSSFSYLHQLRIDTLKIDRSFVENVARDSSGQQIVRSMIGLAQGLGLNIVAEGVETEEQRQWLMNNGCAMMQGYLFARPFKPADYYMFLSNAFARASVAGLLPDPQTDAAKLPQ